ncbi:MAG: PKD domain-containing protein [Promethearchaeota archaeon]
MHKKRKEQDITRWGQKLTSNTKLRSSAVILCMVLTISYGIVMNEKRSKVDQNTLTNDLDSATVYAPWTRITIWSDMGENWRGGEMELDIDGDGVLEMAAMLANNQLVIINYSQSQYNRQYISIPEITGKNHYGFDAYDFNQNGIPELYVFTNEDKTSYWENQIWQGERQSYDTWEWNLVYNSTNPDYSIHNHILGDSDSDGIPELFFAFEAKTDTLLSIPIMSLEYNSTSQIFQSLIIQNYSIQYPGSPAYGFTLGDVTTDGENELFHIVSSTTNTTLYQLKLNETSGTWTDLMIDTENDVGTLQHCKVADIDNDLQNELVYAEYLNPSHLYYCKWNGTDYEKFEIFSSSWNGGPMLQDIVDIDNDGKNEIIVYHNEICCRGCIYIIEGSGESWTIDQIFEDTAMYIGPGAPIIDLNQDGQLEVYHFQGYSTYRSLHKYESSGYPAIPYAPRVRNDSLIRDISAENPAPRLYWPQVYANVLDNYHIQISDTYNFSSLLVDDNGIDPAQNSYAITPEDYNSDQIYWYRVSAINGSGESVFSKAMRFTLVSQESDSGIWETIFTDDFESYTLNTFPSSEYELLYNGAGDSYQNITDAQSISGNQSFTLTGQSSWTAMAAKPFGFSEEIIAVEVNVRTAGIDQTGDSNIDLEFRNPDIGAWGTYYAAITFMDDGNMVLRGGSSTVNLIEYSADTWYKLRLEVNVQTNYSKAYVDNVIVGESQMVRDCSLITDATLAAGWTGNTAYFDDLAIYQRIIPELIPELIPTAFFTTNITQIEPLSPILNWDALWDGGGLDQGYDVAFDSNYGFFITGYTYSYGAGGPDLLLMNYFPNGTLKWYETFGGANLDYGSKLVLDSFGNIYVIGRTNSYGNGDFDALLLKYNYTGDLQWNRTWGGSGLEIGSGIAMYDDNTIYITGKTSSFGSLGTDLLVLKFNSSGDLLWNTTWGAADVDYGSSIAVNFDGHLFIAGGTNSMGEGGYDVCFLEFDSNGVLLWNDTWGGTSDDIGSELEIDPFGNKYIMGDTKSFGLGGEIVGQTGDDIAILKYDQSNNFLWNKTFGTTFNEKGRGLTIDSFGNLIISGCTLYETSINQLLLVKFDNDGNYMWNATWASSLHASGGGVCLDDDFNIIVVGLENNYPSGNYGNVILFNYSDAQWFNLHHNIILPNKSIHFMDLSSGGNSPLSYEWDFGDGSTNSTEQNPIHQFQSTGNYSVSLKVTDSDGNVGYFSIIINVIEGVIPVASFTLNSTSIYVGEYIAFTDTSTNGDLPLIYEWEFGDGSTNSTEQHPVHQYLSVGNFSVILHIIDANGDHDYSNIVEIEVIPVDISAALEVLISVNSSQLFIGDSIECSAAIEGGVAPYIYNWNFGDGTGNSSIPSPLHTYFIFGEFIVSLTVTDDEGNVAFNTLAIEVSRETNRRWIPATPEISHYYCIDSEDVIWLEIYVYITQAGSLRMTYATANPVPVPLSEDINVFYYYKIEFDEALQYEDTLNVNFYFPTDLVSADEVYYLRVYFYNGTAWSIIPQQTIDKDNFLISCGSLAPNQYFAFGRGPESVLDDDSDDGGNSSVTFRIPGFTMSWVSITSLASLCILIAKRNSQRK